jgi:Uma2 family endonuclease
VLMADPGPKNPRATYQDVLDAPEHKVAEIVDGELFLSPRPARPHSRAATALGGVLVPPFDFGSGGPGGWLIDYEPELHLGDDIVVPDLGGWRREHKLEEPNEAFYVQAPDWVCEVLSPSTEQLDRTRKLRVYAREGVQHVWLVHPRWRTLEIFRLHEGTWMLVATHAGESVVRAEPFDAIDLDLSLLWRDSPFPPPSRASDLAAEYGTP